MSTLIARGASIGFRAVSLAVHLPRVFEPGPRIEDMESFSFFKPGWSCRAICCHIESLASMKATQPSAWTKLKRTLWALQAKRANEKENHSKRDSSAMSGGYAAKASFSRRCCDAAHARHPVLDIESRIIIQPLELARLGPCEWQVLQPSLLWAQRKSSIFVTVDVKERSL